MVEVDQIPKLVDTEKKKKVLTESQKVKRNKKKAAWLRRHKQKLKNNLLNEISVPQNPQNLTDNPQNPKNLTENLANKTSLPQNQKNLTEDKIKKQKKHYASLRNRKERRRQAKENQATIEVPKTLENETYPPLHEPAPKKQKLSTNPETCSCPKNKSKSSQQPSPYSQLGSASSLIDLRKIFKQKYGEEVALHQLYYRQNPTALWCEPSGEIYKPEKGERVTVFFTNHPKACFQHQYMVLAIIVRKAIEDETLDRFDDFLRNKFIPLEKKKTSQRGNFSVCLKCLKNKKKRCKDPASHSKCKCNEPESAWSFGCGTKSKNSKVCKFNILPKKSVGRKRFCVKGKEDNAELESFVTEAVDKLSLLAFEHVPKAAKNNLKFVEPAKDCQLGSQSPKVFTGFSINFDYCAHPHVDKNDYPLGTNAILSLRSKEASPTEQLHVLPNYCLKKKGGVLGLKLLLPNSSICFENAANEVHSSTKADQPNPKRPRRIALVAFLHQSLDKISHGQFYKSQAKTKPCKQNETDNKRKLRLNLFYVPKESTI